MKKWYDEEYEFEIEVTGFLRGDKPENYCRNEEEIGATLLGNENFHKGSFWKITE